MTRPRYPEWRYDVPVRGYQLHSADWWDGHDVGYSRGVVVGQRTPDPAVVEELARQWLHDDAARLAREVAALISDERTAQLARERAGRAAARARLTRPHTRHLGGDAA